MLQVRFADERAIGVASLAIHDGNEISTTIYVARRGKRCLHERSGDDYRKRRGEFHGSDSLVLAATNEVTLPDGSGLARLKALHP